MYETTTGEFDFLTDEAIAGDSLAKKLAAGALPVHEVLRHAVELAAILNQAHSQSRIHGDVRPERIVLMGAGLRLLRPENPGARLDITPYTAPEVVQGAVPDARSDIFSFGAVVYEMATGWRAFNGGGPEEYATAILNHSPHSIPTLLPGQEPAAVYIGLDRVIAGCLMKDPDQRRQRMHNALLELKLVARSATKVSAHRPAPALRHSAEAPAAPAGVRLVESKPRAAAAAAGFSSPIVPAYGGPAALPPQHPFGTRASASGRVPPDHGRGAATLTPARDREDYAYSPYRRPVAAVPPLAPPTAAPGVAPRTNDAGAAAIGIPALTAPEEPAKPDLPPAVAHGAELAAAEPECAAEQDTAAEPLAAEPEIIAATPALKPPARRPRCEEMLGPRSRRPRRRWLRIAASFAAVAAGATLAYTLLHRRPAQPTVLKFDVTAPENTSYPGMAAVAPNGRRLTFSALGPEGKRLLWLRPLDALHAATIAGSEGAFAPFWSSDSEYVAFFSDQSLKKVRVTGGLPVSLAPTEGTPGGGTWNPDGVIVFAPNQSGGLYQLTSAGAAPEPLTTLNTSRKERAHLWPQFLPDGKHFIFFVLTDFDETSGVYVGSLDRSEKEPVRLFTSDTSAIYSAGMGLSSRGYLLYVRGRAMMAVEFDASKRQVNGSPFVLADDVGAIESMGLSPISSSLNGILVYQNLGKATRQLAWFDRAGKPLGILGEPGDYGPPRISPDGRKVIVGRLAPNSQSADLWLFDTQTGAGTQFTATPSHEGSPVWSPDGSRVTFFSDQDGVFDIYEKSVAPGSKAELLVRNNIPKYPNDWSPDGKHLLFIGIGGNTKSDLWTVPLSGERKPQPVLQTIYSEGYAVFSPDQRWIAYQSDQSGKVETYVQKFPTTDLENPKRWQISVDGGGLPRWRNPHEIIYITASGRVMSVSVKTNGEDFSAEAPKQLFVTRPIPRSWNLYDVTASGDRFLLNLPLEWSSTAPITVITNWTDKLKK